MSASNVFQLQFPVNEVYEVYKSFISIHENNSARTATDYDRRVREYFNLVLDKQVQHVTAEDILGIKKSRVQTKYIDELRKRGNKYSSIKVKLNTIRSFYNELQSNDINVNPMIFRIKLPDDGKHHESLDREEIEMLFNFMKDEKELATEKYLLVKMLFTTANRKTATMGVKSECGMTWEDNFVVRKDLNTHQNIHVVRVMDKGNQWIEKPISDEFYEELQQINNGQKHVFSFSPKTLQRALERFSKVLDRKITPHSLKASAITIGYMMSRDIELCRQLGGHSSIVTTEIYLHEDKALTNQLSYNMSIELKDEELESLSHRELLDLIKSNEDIKRALLLRLRLGK